MDSAPAHLPNTPSGAVTAGIDWARDDHAVAVVDATGRTLERFTVPHTAQGLRDLPRRLHRAGAGEVAIERPDGPVVQSLLDAALTVVVISPNQVKNLRSRYGSAGNKDDRFDAFVLADTLRTDRARLRPLTPDSPRTTALRVTCRARKDLVHHRVALANQLRAHLRNALPGAVGLFADIDSPVSLRFLVRFDCQDRADWLTPTRMSAWLDGAGYSGRTTARTLCRRLKDAPPRAHRKPRHRPDPRHPGPGRGPEHRHRADQSPLRPDHRATAPAPRRPRVHLPAPLGNRPRSPTPRRDR
ncbi:IS110 family transposase [Streptomyces sp. CB01881]|uniref:IS110 family transposase n=1 Tax=Streptomyces sp. CB01881 TaxID=2078691 RepID=UPI001F11C013|nr:IS110 family transposase [Streptomyces sp. CB01881]